MKRKIETEFAFEIGDVVKRPPQPATVYTVLEQIARICRRGIRHSYVVRGSDDGWSVVAAVFEVRESDIELVEPLPARKETNGEAPH